MTIWKYEINVRRVNFIDIPVGARIIHAGLDPSGVVCVWAIVDPVARKEKTGVMIFGTGDYISDDMTPEDHVGSFVSGPFVWHVFSRFDRDTNEGE